jgi:hypothetical protein
MRENVDHVGTSAQSFRLGRVTEDTGDRVRSDAVPEGVLRHRAGESAATIAVAPRAGESAQPTAAPVVAVKTAFRSADDAAEPDRAPHAGRPVLERRERQ